MTTTPTPATVYQRLRNHLTALKLADAAEALPRVLDQAQAEGWSLTQALEHLLHVAQHRGGGQAPLVEHPGPIPIQQLIQRRQGRLCFFNKASLSEILQRRSHSSNPGNRSTSRASSSHEHRHQLLIELGHLNRLLQQPHPDLAEVLQHVPDRAWRIPPLCQPCPISLDLQAQQSGISPRTCHRTEPPSWSTVPHGQGSTPRGTIPRIAATTSQRNPVWLRHQQPSGRVPRHSRSLGIGRAMRISA